MMRAIVELAYETAMRRGEIVKLKPKHLHLEDRILSVVDGKTGDRSVPLKVSVLFRPKTGTITAFTLNWSY